MCIKAAFHYIFFCLLINVVLTLLIIFEKFMNAQVFIEVFTKRNTKCRNFSPTIGGLKRGLHSALLLAYLFKGYALC